MLRVRVKIPEVDIPYFESIVKEEDYDKLREFLSELDSKFGEGNVECKASVVDEKPETTEEKEEETDPIAEHIKDHPVMEKFTPKELNDFFNKLDSIETMEDSGDIESKEECCCDECCEECIEAKAVVDLSIISDIYYREEPELKRNVVDGTYPVFDKIQKEIGIRIPQKVLDQCSNYNIAQFIKQQVIFTLMDPEYCDIDDDKLDEVFCKDNFDDSYCYDTGVYKIKITDLEDVPFSYAVLKKYFKEYDYREMEDTYISLRLFDKED